MSKVIHESKPGRYVVEYQTPYYDSNEWTQWKSFDTPEKAIVNSDGQQMDNPGEKYRVVDTELDSEVISLSDRLFGDKKEEAA